MSPWVRRRDNPKMVENPGVSGRTLTQGLLPSFSLHSVSSKKSLVRDFPTGRDDECKVTGVESVYQGRLTSFIPDRHRGPPFSHFKPLEYRK